MGPLVAFWLIFVGFLGLVAAFATIPFWFEHAVVFAMRKMRIYAFPDAIRLAVSLERDTGEWRFSRHVAEHTTIGKVNYWDTAAMLNVDVKGGNDTAEWRPRWLERRIICDAAVRAHRRILHQRMDQVLPH